MATTKAGPISADRLKSFIERIEKLEEERKAIGGDIKDVYSEAKGVGYDVATMRKIVAIRAKDTADVAEQETLLDVYKHALGMLTAGTVTTVRVPQEPSEEDLEERAGRIVSEVDRCMDLVANGQPPGIYAIQGLIGCSAGKASKLRGMVADRISRSEAKVREMKSPPVSPTQAYIDSFAAPKPEDGDDGITEEADWQAFRREEDGPVDNFSPPDSHEAESGQLVGQNTNETGAFTPDSLSQPATPLDLAQNEVQPSATPSVGAVAASSPRVAPHHHDHDDLRIPSFLDRRTAQGRNV